MDESLKVIVDYEACASTGSCVQTCPEVFELDRDGNLRVLIEEPDEGLRGPVTDAADLCPNSAITIEG